MAQKTVKLYFDGEEKECLVQTQADGEILCISRDHRFVKFPEGTDLKKAVKEHNALHKDVPVFAGEDPAEQQSEELKNWLAGD